MTDDEATTERDEAFAVFRRPSLGFALEMAKEDLEAAAKLTLLAAAHAVSAAASNDPVRMRCAIRDIQRQWRGTVASAKRIYQVERILADDEQT